jgi:hypothetical protein
MPELALVGGRTSPVPPIPPTPGGGGGGGGRIHYYQRGLKVGEKPKMDDEFIELLPIIIEITCP